MPGARFVRGTSVLELSRYAELGNGETWGRVQARGRTQDGTFQAADKGVQVRQFRLSFREMTTADKDDLESFVNTVAVGSTLEVNYTDHNGDQWVVKFLSERLDFTENWDSGAGRFDVSFNLEVLREVVTS